MPPSKTDDYYLKKIKHDIEYIETKMNGINQFQFQLNEMLSDSMCFRLIQISENAKFVSDEFKERHPKVPWSQIAGLRNHIVHDYGNIDFPILYHALTIDIPNLKEKLEQ